MNGVTSEVLATPLETKIWAAFRGKQDVIVARFIVTDWLERRGENVTWEP